MANRRFLAPEVVQSSAMDCGPAALKCLLEGFGVAASYDRLREACQTDVDGTSIDSLEEVAAVLGLDAEQVMIPEDHLLLDESEALPALVVIRNSLGATHFVVVWARFGRWVQVMDPASGRRWMPAASLLGELYSHVQEVPAAAWREWAGSDDFLRPLDARLAEIGVGRELRRRWAGEAVEDPGWRSMATLDAATRLVQSLVDAGGVARGGEAGAVLKEMLRECRADTPAGDRELIPESFWSVRPAGGPAPGDGEPGTLLLRGAVLIRVRGRRAAADGPLQPDSAPALSPELAAAVQDAPVHPLRALFRFLGADGRRAFLLIAVAVAVAAAGALLEILFFRGLLDLGVRLTVTEQRATMFLGLLVFLVGLMLVDIQLYDVSLRAGRKLEVRLRLRFLDKIARLGERYFHSRLNSDMAERCHSVHRLRLAAEVVGVMMRSGFHLLFLVLGIAWIDPGSAPWAVLSGLLALVLPTLAQPLLAERDLRMRNHAGALGRFNLDALLGLAPLRSHVADRPLRAEHESLLKEWMDAALRRERAVVFLDMVQSSVGYGFAILILARHLWVGSDASQMLLLAYWAMNIPMRGQELAQMAQQLPQIQNTARRLLEPLAAEDEETMRSAGTEEGAGAGPGPEAPGVALRFRGVGVVAAGHRILAGVTLDLRPGEAVAIVGPSGAGKSSLVGLLLGWHRPVEGTLLVDGDPCSGAVVDRLRRETAWVDPGVQLWNQPLLDNVLYGSQAREVPDLTPVLDAALLRHLLESLPDGWQTALGEGGALVSGGEGQRVRYARSLLRPEARLVILDEPFRGLDRVTRGRLLRSARAWWPQATFLCITHDLQHTRDFDRVLVVKAGRVVEDGVPEELVRRPGSAYRAMLTADVDSRKHFRNAAAWRRLHLAGGRLTVDDDATPAEVSDLAAREAQNAGLDP